MVRVYPEGSSYLDVPRNNFPREALEASSSDVRITQAFIFPSEEAAAVLLRACSRGETSHNGNSSCVAQAHNPFLSIIQSGNHAFD